jgi:hypothetical protein
MGAKLDIKISLEAYRDMYLLRKAKNRRSLELMES